MDKLARLFIKRLHMDARRQARRNALANGALELKIIEWEGNLIRRYAPKFDTSQFMMDLTADLIWFRKHYGFCLRSSKDATSPKPEEVALGDSALQRRSGGRLVDSAAVEQVGPQSRQLIFTSYQKRSSSSAIARQSGAEGVVSAENQRREYAVRLVGEAGTPPPTSQLITALILARAMSDGKFRLQDVMRLLRSPAPFVSVQSEMKGAESQIVRLLEQTHLAGDPRWSFASGGIRYDHDDDHRDVDNGSRPAVHYDGTSLLRVTAGSVRRRLVNALSRDMPILVTSDRPDKVPETLLVASDLSLFIRRVDRKLIEDIVIMLFGEEARSACDVLPERFAFGRLTTDDLLLAFRPGRSATSALDVLVALAARNTDDDDDASGEGVDEFGFDLEHQGKALSADGKEKGTPKSSPTGKPPSAKDKKDDKTASGGGWKRDQPSGAEVIQPEEIGSDDLHAADENGRRPPTVEGLSGYGKARDWALGLRADLTDYLTDELAWSDMSTKLLLSGPPGTGKTTFARALCNTLQIPLVVTSVSTWLEGGHLNDVIKKMAKTFEEARALAPAILFIDEIDGIGKRQPADREYADYWNTVVNKALELLDGAVKAEGVIVVGATNRPEQIDEALRRSGRLETHIEIPHPDVDALAGILAHHLGGDVVLLESEAMAAAGKVASHPSAEDAVMDEHLITAGEVSGADANAGSLKTASKPSTPHAENCR